MRVVCRDNSEGGRDWIASRFQLDFYPTFWSRFRPVRRWYSFGGTCQLQKKYLGRRGNHILKIREKFIGLMLAPDCPEVTEWIRENASGKVKLRVSEDLYTDIEFGSRSQKTTTYDIHFADARDAVAFKLTFL